MDLLFCIVYISFGEVYVIMYLMVIFMILVCLYMGVYNAPSIYVMYL